MYLLILFSGTTIQDGGKRERSSHYLSTKSQLEMKMKIREKNKKELSPLSSTSYAVLITVMSMIKWNVYSTRGYELSEAWVNCKWHAHFNM